MICTMMKKGKELKKNIGSKSLHHFVQRLLVPSVRQQVVGTLSQWFHVKKGVRQGCLLSPYLFNTLAEMVMRETPDGCQGGLQIGGRIVTNLCNADDIILLATSDAELQELVDCVDCLD